MVWDNFSFAFCVFNISHGYLTFNCIINITNNINIKKNLILPAAAKWTHRKEIEEDDDEVKEKEREEKN